ncbi:hypothetical protein [Variovorax arabinosiphilus]|uniref:hypothetical protein n=1 Tax=Variovorax arabinosiphilus TaxID=3053498 RepID=UPI002577B5F6|nr:MULTISPECIES: hypothetical protein [unclassified Variovorax]MDM0123170.1 hypothetical protein [Variovorax sp. J2L1-78]MDM0131834.1 hypothetical protein [Variovorax sp. J2L1-63]MDM0235933.1 hypothetical protein [Variovorax sp. J2R1-6]
MKDAKAPQEDVTGLFRKFGGDAAAYKEFAPADIPAATRPIAPVPAPLPALHALAPAPAAGVTPPPVAPAAEPLPVAAKEAPVVPSAPRELDRLFARLDACTPIPARVAPGLTAHWRKPG